MKKEIKFLIVLFFLLLSLTLSAAEGFYISGGNLMDANNNKFVIRGISNPHAWYDSPAYDGLTAIAGLKTNAVRIVWTLGGSAARLEQVIQRCIALEMIAIPELHDVTGKDDAASLNSCVNYWIRSDIKAVLNKYRKYVILNIANEWMGTWNKWSDWANAYKNAITALRNNGIEHTLLVDAAGWGQEYQSVYNKGQEVFSADPQKNVLFAVHMYGVYGSASKVQEAIHNITGRNIPMIVGEFGWNHSDGDVDEAAIMQECRDHDLGYIAWSWKGNSGGVEYLDLSTSWNPPGLTAWGNTVFNSSNGIKNTAVKCSVFSGGPTLTPVPTPTVVITPAPTPTVILPPHRMGDVNGDSMISIIDALMIAQYSVGLPVENFDPVSGDVDCSGSVSILDALMVAQYTVGLISEFQCQAPTLTPTYNPPTSRPFISRSGSKLYENGNVFRFVSVNIPNYFLVEDRAGTFGSKWHRVTEFEQRDACRTVKALGGQVFRTYVFSVQGGVNVENNLAHVTGSNGTISYNEELFRDVDRGLAIAAEEGLRVIIPFVDNWDWFGGYAQWAALSGGGDFWTNTTTKNRFKEFITWVVNRTNTVTGVKYKDDPTIMSWELGNEVDKANDTWIREMAAHVKSQAPKQLVTDGTHKYIPAASLSCADIDIVTSHYTDPDIESNVSTAASNNKAYFYGEFSTDGDVRGIVNRTISTGAAGCLIWSLRFRTEYGGFYFHSDFSGDSLQYPGFDQRETEIFTILKEGAYRIRGFSAPSEPVPPAPVLLSITSSSKISWKGSTGALSYSVQRSASSGGSWYTVASAVTDIGKVNFDGQNVAALPLYSDSPGSGTWYYRIIAQNGAGESPPSNVQSITQ